MINKIVLTRGAVFDYEEIICGRLMDRWRFRAEAEKLIEDSDKETLRIVFFDTDSDKELLLFLRCGRDFGIMRLWILEGICETKDYDAEMENNGVIEEWLKIVIE